MKRMRMPLPLLLVAALAGCNGTGVDGLQPSQADGFGLAPGAPTSTAMLPLQGGGGTAAALSGPIVTSARVVLAPVMGTSPEALPALSARLAEQAGRRGVPLVRQGSGGTLTMRGYFSAFTENRETAIIYVWDITDAAGRRLHRIQGRERTEGGAAGGWRSVTPQIMQAIADRTVDELALWLAAQAR